MTVSVGIVGASGFAGRELVRLLEFHPEVDRLTVSMSNPDRSREGFPEHASVVEHNELLEMAGDATQVTFFATPSGVSGRHARAQLDAGSRVIDLSADFRFADKDAYERAHGLVHPDPELLAQSSYGSPEFNREHIGRSKLVANPGCFAELLLIALVPLLQGGVAEPGVVVSAVGINGTTGASQTPTEALQHHAVEGSLLAYGMDGHRHTPEVEQQIRQLVGVPVTLDFSTAHGPFARGIHLHVSVPVAREVDRNEVIQLIMDSHAHTEFVDVVTERRRGSLTSKQYDLYPQMSRVRFSNLVSVGVDVDRFTGRIRLVVVGDNLGKGAAGTAIENMNLMLGLDYRTGLLGSHV